MSLFTRRAAIGPIAALLLLAACQTNASPSPSTSGNATSGASPSQAAASTAPSQVATVPEDQLVLAGNLFVCIDVPYPPQEAFAPDGTIIGSDPDIATEIAKRLGLQAHFVNTVFTVIIPALDGNKCDIIVSAQNINADRLKQVDMIPYFKAGQSFVVAKGNPKHITSQDGLCGNTVAVQNGTTELDFLQGTSDFAGKGLSDACVAGGKAAITIKQFDKDNDALLALQSGTADAYFADSPAAGYAVENHPTQFELSGVTLEVAIEGISVAKNHTTLRDAVKTVLLSMISDGRYGEILTTWGVTDGGLTADQVNSGNL
ncbi:MAG: ABC transporter substrate-binding protein [Chloroflexota bacterium]|nr:ABC transporter substrate-binding protein [Chloroflexota bacterium]